MEKTLKKNNKGFTLVELIVVLVILAILAAVLVPALLGYIDRTKSTQCELNRSYLKKSVTAVYVDDYSLRGNIKDITSLSDELSLYISKYYDDAVATGNLLEYEGVCNEGGTVFIKDVEFTYGKLTAFEVRCSYHDNESGYGDNPGNNPGNNPPVPSAGNVTDGLTGFANTITNKFSNNSQVNGNNYYLMRASETISPNSTGKDAFGAKVPLRISLDGNTNNSGSGKYRVLTSGNNVNNNNQGLASIFKNSIIDKADDNEEIYNEINWSSVTVNYIDVSLQNSTLDSGNNVSKTSDVVKSVDGFQLVQKGNKKNTYTVFTYVNGSWNVEKDVTSTQFGFLN